LAEERQIGLARPAENLEVDLDEPDLARLRERDGLRPEPLRGEHAAALRLRRVEPDPLEIARELLDRVDRSEPLDLDRDPAAGVVVNEDRPVRLQHHEAHRLGENGVEPPGVDDLAAGDEQAHAGNVLSLSDVSPQGCRSTEACPLSMSNGTEVCECVTSHSPS